MALTQQQAFRAPRRGEREGTLGRPPLGEILLRRGEVTREALDHALARSRFSGARIGETLVADGAAAEEAVARALGEQLGVGYADLAAEPPGPGLLSYADSARCLRLGAIPWRRIGGAPVIATCEPQSGPDAIAALAPEAPAGFVVSASRAGIRAAIAKLFPVEIAARAAGRTPRKLSAAGFAGPLARLAMAAALAAGAFAAAGAPGAALAAAFAAGCALAGISIALRIACLRAPPPPLAAAPPAAGAGAAQPFVTLLVPLYREPEVAARLVAALRRLDYPRARIEALLVLEEGDEATAEAIDAAQPEGWIRRISAPRGAPRTKPRALNAALEFARGEIVGVYDAEDLPDPAQLREVAAAFRAAAPKVACVQARLGFFNARDGWLSRCFAIEYATWFHLVLPGYRRLGLPLPLGGTSVFFRRSVLEAIGAWDAHNVTEDADLGIRLARAGYRTELIGSETQEEATTRVLAWIRQRSRWQKGYLQTWLTHMRRPGRLWRDLGPRGFLGMQAHFLGAASAFLSPPLFWGVAAWWWATGAPPWPDGLFSPALTLAMLVVLGGGQAALLATSVAALRRAGRRELIPWALTMPLYWPLSSLAALKSLAETLVAPSWWDKTRHGRSQAPPELLFPPPARP